MAGYDNIRITESGYVIDEHDVHLKLNTGEEIWGTINIADYDVSRLSELFTKSDLYFVVVYNCTPNEIVEEGEKTRILFINKDHITWVEPVK